MVGQWHSGLYAREAMIFPLLDLTDRWLYFTYSAVNPKCPFLKSLLVIFPLGLKTGLILFVWSLFTCVASSSVDWLAGHGRFSLVPHVLTHYLGVEVFLGFFCIFAKVLWTVYSSGTFDPLFSSAWCLCYFSHFAVSLCSKYFLYFCTLQGYYLVC